MINLILAASLASSPVPVPDYPELTAQISARDAAVFDVFFNQCQPEKLRALVTPDVEFYHDKGGVVALNAGGLIADYEKSCTARQAPDAWRSRRELVASSLKVDPVPGFGAIEEGDHQFFERQGDGPEKLVGTAHFVILWALTADGWRMKRVLSYGHHAVAPSAPTP